MKTPVKPTHWMLDNEETPEERQQRIQGKKYYMETPYNPQNLITPKPAVKSVGIWGGLIALVPAFSALLGLTGLISPELVTQGFTLLMATVGGVVAIIGRYKADKKITSII